MTDQSTPTHLNRRDFVTFVGGFLGAAMGIVLGLPLIGYLLSPALSGGTDSQDRVSLGPLDQYPLNKPTLFSFTRSTVNGWEKSSTSHAVYVLRTAEKEVKILSTICPHLSCHVVWHEDLQQYVCPCHEAHFDPQGMVISGPPPRPMWIYPATIDPNGTLSIQPGTEA